MRIELAKRSEKSSEINFTALWNVTPFPSVVLDRNNMIFLANYAAEIHFSTSVKKLLNQTLDQVFGKASLFDSLIDSVRVNQKTVIQYDLNFTGPLFQKVIQNIRIIPCGEKSENVLIVFETSSDIDKLKKVLPYKTAAKSVAAMSSMLAHEIRNPLAGIFGAAELLEKSVNISDRELTELIKMESMRIGKLVDTFEKFGEMKSLDCSNFNIHDVLDRSIKSMVSVFGDEIMVTKNYDPSLPDVFGDSDQILQMFQNILKNSFESFEGKIGKIKVQTRFNLGFKNLPLVILISDNGPGIPLKLRDQIFQPFISSKSQGSGLGLSLVSKIVSDHNGIIDFVTGDDGTKFRVLLPWKKITKGVESDLEYMTLDSL